jgi:hypothetical protein
MRELPSLEYIAAFFDAEGHVEKRRRYICFTQKDRGLLEDIQAVIGGSIYTKNGGKCHRLMLWTNDSLRVAPLLKPYSRTGKLDCFR